MYSLKFGGKGRHPILQRNDALVMILLPLCDGVGCKKKRHPLGAPPPLMKMERMHLPVNRLPGRQLFHCTFIGGCHYFAAPDLCSAESGEVVFADGEVERERALFAAGGGRCVEAGCELSYGIAVYVYVDMPVVIAIRPDGYAPYPPRAGGHGCRLFGDDACAGDRPRR